MAGVVGVAEVVYHQVLMLTISKAEAVTVQLGIEAPLLFLNIHVSAESGSSSF